MLFSNVLYGWCELLELPKKEPSGLGPSLISFPYTVESLAFLCWCSTHTLSNTAVSQWEQGKDLYSSSSAQPGECRMFWVHTQLLLGLSTRHASAQPVFLHSRSVFVFLLIRPPWSLSKKWLPVTRAMTNPGSSPCCKTGRLFQQAGAAAFQTDLEKMCSHFCACVLKNWNISP